MRNSSLFIAIPSGSEWKADFGMSVAGLMAHINQPLANGGRIARVQFHNMKGSILSRSRQKLVEGALSCKCTHILFLDSDMVFPHFLAHQLLRHNVDVVAANCAVKTLPSNPTARYHDPNSTVGRPVYSVGKLGLEQVWRVGTGIMLVNLSVFARMKAPWFDITWNEELNDYTGEDWNFCARLTQAGIPIWVDHTISQHIGHIGSYTYSHSDIETQTSP